MNIFRAGCSRAIRLQRIVVEKVVGVKNGVAVIFEQVPVELVGARSRDEFDGAARVATIFGLRATGDDTEFFNGVCIVRVQCQTEARRRRVIDVDPVQSIVV